MTYTKDQALGFVEQSAYLGETARRHAHDVLDEADIEQMLEDPDAAAQTILDKLVALLMTDVVWAAATDAQRHVLALGLTEVTNDEAAQSIEEAIQNLEQIEPELADRIRQVDESLRRDGTADAVILAALASPAGREAALSPVTGFLQGASAGVVTMIEQGVDDLAQGKTVAAVPETKLRWHATGDGNSCVDLPENSCEPRDGIEKTLDEWRALGLPGAGNLLCSMYSRSGLPQCRCKLGNANVARSEPGVLDVTEAVKAGKARANQ